MSALGAGSQPRRCQRSWLAPRALSRPPVDLLLTEFGFAVQLAKERDQALVVEVVVVVDDRTAGLDVPHRRVRRCGPRAGAGRKVQHLDAAEVAREQAAR